MQEIVYHTNFKLENEYWWFVARNEIVFDIIKNKVNIPNNSVLLDVGCGTGGFAKKIDEIHDVNCLDMSPTALDYCKKRGLKKLFLGILSDLPKDVIPQVVTMLDVVEHIDEDFEVVKQVYDLLPSGGYFVATVPAYMWMWSKHDEIHMHKRRYTITNFRNMLKKAGFEIEYSGYFNTILFPIAALKRIVDKITGAGKKADEPVEKVSPFLNSIFTKLFMSEKALLKLLRFPFGVSIIVVAKKR